jgi:hypothetical protein
MNRYMVYECQFSIIFIGDQVLGLPMVLLPLILFSIIKHLLAGYLCNRKLVTWETINLLFTSYQSIKVFYVIKGHNSYNFHSHQK